MEILKRFTNPSKHVLEPYGTVCQNETQFFVQISKDPECANWITLGELYENMFPGADLTQEFLKKCLDSLENKKVSL